MQDDNNNQNPFTPFTPTTDLNTDDHNKKDVEMLQSPFGAAPVQAADEDEEEYPQDERIVDYLIDQVIPTKHPELSAEKVVEEKDRLYKILENGIFETAYNQLSEEHKNELDTLMKYGADIPAIQAFFIEKIPNIQVQLGKYMEDFVQKYLRGEV